MELSLSCRHIKRHRISHSGQFFTWPLALLLLLSLLAPSHLLAQGSAKEPTLPDPDISYPRKEPGATMVGDQLVSNGVPSKIYQFKTKDTPDKVIQYYEEAWKAKGYITHQEQIGAMTNIIAVTSPGKNLIKSVLAYIDPNDQLTMVFTSSSIMDLSDQYSKVPKDIPVHPKSEVFSTFSSGGGDGDMHLIVHKNAYSASFVKTFYQNAMKQKGWSGMQDSRGAAGGADPDSLIFKKDSRTCIISFMKEDGGGSFIVFNIMKGS
jgi:hypothetical protein